MYKLTYWNAQDWRFQTQSNHLTAFLSYWNLFLKIVGGFRLPDGADFSCDKVSHAFLLEYISRADTGSGAHRINAPFQITQNVGCCKICSHWNINQRVILVDIVLVVRLTRFYGKAWNFQPGLEHSEVCKVYSLCIIGQVNLAINVVWMLQKTLSVKFGACFRPRAGCILDWDSRISQNFLLVLHIELTSNSRSTQNLLLLFTGFHWFVTIFTQSLAIRLTTTYGWA